MFLFASSNPFVTAYLQSDWLGKGIFWALFLLSAISWIMLIHKGWVYYRVKQISEEFQKLFSEKEPLSLLFTPLKESLIEVPHPFFEMYKALKQKTLQIIGRNHFFAPNSEGMLSESDLALIDTQVQATLAAQQKTLDKNLFVLSTVVTLGPFLGLLGTVWGILLTFMELNARSSANNAAMLTGLSMALATTVIGLIVAIPALIGYNYFRNTSREYRRDMEDFACLLVSAIELQYRRPDHAQKSNILS